ncbi:hypothetical protein DN402_22060 [Streptomyces sp. SW4]|nr:hypothetical protein DN402_22060 [Streptomyces sp. SW4]
MSGAEPGPADERRRALLRTARDVAEDLAADAVDRDRAGMPPADEAARLREAGLPAALTPPGPGRGTDWRTGCAVVQEIAAADASVGEILARHYVHTWSGRFYGPARRAAVLEAETARHQWLWAGAVHGPPSPGDTDGPDLTLTPHGDGHTVAGRRRVDTAVTVADQFVADARCAVTGEVLVVRIPRAARGVSAEPRHDRLGQRVAGAGSLVLDGVAVAPAHVLGPGRTTRRRPRPSPRSPLRRSASPCATSASASWRAPSPRPATWAGTRASRTRTTTRARTCC